MAPTNLCIGKAWDEISISNQEGLTVDEYHFTELQSLSPKPSHSILDILVNASEIMQMGQLSWI